MLYRYEVIADSSGNWTGNGVCFRTYDQAMQSAQDLMSRWTLVTDIRVVEVSEKEAEEKKYSIKEVPIIKGPDHRVQL